MLSYEKTYAVLFNDNEFEVSAYGKTARIEKIKKATAPTKVRLLL